MNRSSFSVCFNVVHMQLYILSTYVLCMSICTITISADVFKVVLYFNFLLHCSLENLLKININLAFNEAKFGVIKVSFKFITVPCFTRLISM